MLHRLRWLPASPPVRRPLTAGVVLLYALVACGLPIPGPRNLTGIPFPCAGRGCGCATAESCWAGACCCFTAREKLAWAEAHQFIPPAHFLRAVEREREATAGTGGCPHCAAEKSCCPVPKSEPVPAGGRLVGLSALKCKGQSAGGPSGLPPALPPAPGVAFDPAAKPAFARGPARSPVARPAAPPVPPPRPA